MPRFLLKHAAAFALQIFTVSYLIIGLIFAHHLLFTATFSTGLWWFFFWPFGADWASDILLLLFLGGNSALIGYLKFHTLTMASLVRGLRRLREDDKAAATEQQQRIQALQAELAAVRAGAAPAARRYEPAEQAAQVEIPPPPETAAAGEDEDDIDRLYDEH